MVKKMLTQITENELFNVEFDWVDNQVKIYYRNSFLLSFRIFDFILKYNDLLGGNLLSSKGEARLKLAKILANKPSENILSQKDEENLKEQQKIIEEVDMLFFCAKSNAQLNS